MFPNFKSFIDAQTAGKETINLIAVQPPTQSLTALQWRDTTFFGDFSAAGTPLTFYPLSGSVRADSYLTEATVISTASDFIATHYFLDILGYYKGIDSNVDGLQYLTTPSPIPRDYEGVQAYIVTTSAIAAACQVVIGYTNELGVSGRTSIMFLRAANQGQVQSNLVAGSFAQGMCFMPLLNNDVGVKSIDFVIMATRASGEFAIVLAKPIQTISTSTAGIPTEVVYAVNRSSIPPIKKDANIGLVSFFNNTPAHAPLLLKYNTLMAN